MEIALSPELRKAFDQIEMQLDEFAQHYYKQFKDKKETLDKLGEKGYIKCFAICMRPKSPK